MSRSFGHPEEEGWRLPPARTRCSIPRCRDVAVVDGRSDRRRKGDRWEAVWFSLCTEHLRRRGREVRDGVVWFDPEILDEAFSNSAHGGRGS